MDWSQSRIIFIAPEFTKHQQYAIGFRDLGIQLWEVHKYSNGLLIFNEAKSPFTKEPLTAITKRSPVAKKIAEEIRVYTEEDHLYGVDRNIRELYLELKPMILALGNDIEARPKKRYAAFRRKQNFVAVKFRRSKLLLYLSIKKDQIIDPLNKARDVEGVISAGLTEVTITESKELTYVQPFIKQAYEKS